MGFYIRKSISAGPFRFNLSGSGLGLSVGVKGFRVGTGPRGNYVHMGRGGLYYRASLGGPARPTGRRAQHRFVVEQPAPIAPGSVIETGDVLEMRPSNGSQILDQINEKMALMPFWPWSLIGGGMVGFFFISQPNLAPVGLSIFAVTAVLSAFLGYHDTQRKTVVVMYDLDDDAISPFRTLTEEFDKLRSVNRIWNVDTAERTADWKRNAGASHLLRRKAASLTYSAPRVVKTNLSIPAMLAGRQNIYFFPDIVLIIEGSRAGALSYDQLEVLWTTTVFIESDGVPADAQVVGYTWRFVNKDGGPDRRFNNNRQIPKALYLQMGLTSTAGLRKVLQFSKVLDHRGFDDALSALRGLIRKLKLLALEGPQNPTPQSQNTQSAPAQPANVEWFSISDKAREIESAKPKYWEFRLTVELLHTNLAPLIQRWNQGKPIRGLPAVPLHDVISWCQARLDEFPKFAETITTLLNERLPASWGAPGQSGNANEITGACEQLILCAKQIVDWGEVVRFTPLPREFDEVKSLLRRLVGPVLVQMAKMSDEIERIFSAANPSGKYNIQVNFSTPEHWPEHFNAAMRKAANASGLTST